MGAIAMTFLTAFAAVICGAVLLIQIGGWLPILVAILIILYYFLSTGVLVILIAADVADKKKKMKEAAKRV